MPKIRRQLGFLSAKESVYFAYRRVAGSVGWSAIAFSDSSSASAVVDSQCLFGMGFAIANDGSPMKKHRESIAVGKSIRFLGIAERPIAILVFGFVLRVARFPALIESIGAIITSNVMLVGLWLVARWWNRKVWELVQFAIEVLRTRLYACVDSTGRTQAE